MGYNEKLEEGLQYQDFVTEELAREGIVLQPHCSKKWQYERGENRAGFEIKYDNYTSCSPNKALSIEVAEKTRDDLEAPWVDSGIFTGDNAWIYIHGDYKVAYIFAKRDLLEYYAMTGPEVIAKHGTIKTFYLPYEEAERMALKIIYFGGSP